MAQKAHPNILRPQENLYKGHTNWDNSRFFYTTSTISKLLESCCLGTTHYLNELQINRNTGLIYIEMNLIHLHFKSKRRFFSRRYKENNTINTLQSWTIMACRLQKAVKLIQQFSGIKKVILKINRLKMYTRAIPKTARRQMSFYGKDFNRIRYDYARYGLQLMYLLLRKKASPNTFIRFLKQNIQSRQRRKRHYHFLSYIKKALKVLKRYKKIQGLKIQIKGRFTHKAKGRSRSWNHQIGSMPLSRLDKNIRAEYEQTQTAYGSVGLKVWVCS